MIVYRIFPKAIKVRLIFLIQAKRNFGPDIRNFLLEDFLERTTLGNLCF